MWLPEYVRSQAHAAERGCHPSLRVQSESARGRPCRDRTSLAEKLTGASVARGSLRRRHLHLRHHERIGIEGCHKPPRGRAVHPRPTLAATVADQITAYVLCRNGLKGELVVGEDVRSI